MITLKLFSGILYIFSGFFQAANPVLDVSKQWIFSKIMLYLLNMRIFNSQENFMKTAFAVKSNEIAETLGSSQNILLLEGDASQLLPCPERCNILQLLQQNGAEKLICNKIGCCMIELLQQNNIEVTAGVSGSIGEITEAYRQNRLKPGKNFTCTENGQICGDCPGKF